LRFQPIISLYSEKSALRLTAAHCRASSLRSMPLASAISTASLPSRSRRGGSGVSTTSMMMRAARAGSARLTSVGGPPQFVHEAESVAVVGSGLVHRHRQPHPVRRNTREAILKSAIQNFARWLRRRRRARDRQRRRRHRNDGEQVFRVQRAPSRTTPPPPSSRAQIRTPTRSSAMSGGDWPGSFPNPVARSATKSCFR
jgi:hypothetical protein